MSNVTASSINNSDIISVNSDSDETPSNTASPPLPSISSTTLWQSKLAFHKLTPEEAAKQSAHGMAQLRMECADICAQEERTRKRKEQEQRQYETERKARYRFGLKLKRKVVTSQNVLGQDSSDTPLAGSSSVPAIPPVPTPSLQLQPMPTLSTLQTVPSACQTPSIQQQNALATLALLTLARRARTIPQGVLQRPTLIRLLPPIAWPDNKIRTSLKSYWKPLLWCHFWPLYLRESENKEERDFRAWILLTSR